VLLISEFHKIILFAFSFLFCGALNPGPHTCQASILLQLHSQPFHYALETKPVKCGDVVDNLHNTSGILTVFKTSIHFPLGIENWSPLSCKSC
jgi:hypothetical protein